MPSDSTLGYALLGLLQQAPRSGYDLRKVFVSTPMGLFSDSPGAIYPALKRLSRRKCIAPITTASGGRRRRLFAATELGRRTLASWLTQEPTRDDVARRWDVLMLRLAFKSASAPGALLRFLEAIQAHLSEYTGELERFAANQGHQMPLAAQLAFESGVEGYRAQMRWVGRAVKRVRRRRRVR